MVPPCHQDEATIGQRCCWDVFATFRVLKVLWPTVLCDIRVSVVLRPGQANGLGIVDSHSEWESDGQLTPKYLWVD